MAESLAATIKKAHQIDDGLDVQLPIQLNRRNVSYQNL
jgi:hypothetical protein